MMTVILSFDKFELLTLKQTILATLTYNRNFVTQNEIIDLERILKNINLVLENNINDHKGGKEL